MRNDNIPAEEKYLFPCKLKNLFKEFNHSFFWLLDSVFFEQLKKDVEVLPAIMWVSINVLKNCDRDYAISENKEFQTQKKNFIKLYDKLSSIDFIGNEVNISTRKGMFTIPTELFCTVNNLVSTIVQSINEYQKQLQVEISKFCNLSAKAAAIHMIFLERAYIIPSAFKMAGRRMTSEIQKRNLKYGKETSKYIQKYYSQYMDYHKNNGVFTFGGEIQAVLDAADELKLNPDYNKAYLLAKKWIDENNTKK